MASTLQARERRVERSLSVDVRPVTTPSDLDEVYRITHDSYVDEGYIAPQPDGMFRHFREVDAACETTVFAAWVDGVIAGTVSWTVDGPAGLHCDEDFGDVVDRVRSEGRPLGASWRIAVRREYRGQAAIAMALIGRIVTELFTQGVLTMLATFNPRHERFYRRVLNFRTVARKDAQHGLSSAPVVLMRFDLERIPTGYLRTPEGIDAMVSYLRTMAAKVPEGISTRGHA
jgi:hypothetical protein